jgi:hypothetical protein
VGFVDDDDVIKNTYVETFLQETAKYENDVVIFRMMKFQKYTIQIKRLFEIKDQHIAKIHDAEYKLYQTMDPETFIMINTTTPFPNENATNIMEDDVGISFVAKKHIFDSGIQFNTHYKEDFEFIDTVQKNGYKIMISPFILYFIKHYEEFTDYECNRVFLNHSVVVVPPRE